jgi:hypothetical protein
MHTSEENDSDEWSPSHESSSPSSTHTGFTSNSTMSNGYFQAQQTPTVRPSPDGSQNAVDMPGYTTKLKEHFEAKGGRVDYRKEPLGSNPVTWRCIATSGNFSVEGQGLNAQQAKHAASKKMCALLGLT